MDGKRSPVFPAWGRKNYQKIFLAALSEQGELAEELSATMAYDNANS